MSSAAAKIAAPRSLTQLRNLVVLSSFTFGILRGFSERQGNQARWDQHFARQYAAAAKAEADSVALEASKKPVPPLSELIPEDLHGVAKTLRGDRDAPQ